MAHDQGMQNEDNVSGKILSQDASTQVVNSSPDSNECHMDVSTDQQVSEITLVPITAKNEKNETSACTNTTDETRIHEPPTNTNVTNPTLEDKKGIIFEKNSEWNKVSSVILEDKKDNCANESDVNFESESNLHKEIPLKKYESDFNNFKDLDSLGEKEDVAPRLTVDRCGDESGNSCIDAISPSPEPAGQKNEVNLLNNATNVTSNVEETTLTKELSLDALTFNKTKSFENCYSPGSEDKNVNIEKAQVQSFTTTFSGSWDKSNLIEISSNSLEPSGSNFKIESSSHEETTEADDDKLFHATFIRNWDETHFNDKTSNAINPECVSDTPKNDFHQAGNMFESLSSESISNKTGMEQKNYPSSLDFSNFSANNDCALNTCNDDDKEIAFLLNDDSDRDDLIQNTTKDRQHENGSDHDKEDEKPLLCHNSSSHCSREDFSSLPDDTENEMSLHNQETHNRSFHQEHLDWMKQDDDEKQTDASSKDKIKFSQEKSLNKTNEKSKDDVTQQEIMPSESVAPVNSSVDEIFKQKDLSSNISNDQSNEGICDNENVSTKEQSLHDRLKYYNAQPVLDASDSSAASSCANKLVTSLEDEEGERSCETKDDGNLAVDQSGFKFEALEDDEDFDCLVEEIKNREEYNDILQDDSNNTEWINFDEYNDSRCGLTSCFDTISESHHLAKLFNSPAFTSDGIKFSKMNLKDKYKNYKKTGKLSDTEVLDKEQSCKSSKSENNFKQVTKNKGLPEKTIPLIKPIPKEKMLGWIDSKNAMSITNSLFSFDIDFFNEELQNRPVLSTSDKNNDKQLNEDDKLPKSKSNKESILSVGTKFEDESHQANLSVSDTPISIETSYYSDPKHDLEPLTENTEIIATFNSFSNNVEKLNEDNSPLNLNYITPTTSPSPFETTVWNLPELLASIIRFLGDPAVLCKLKATHKFSNRVISENEQVLMKNCARIGGLQKKLRSAFWMWVTIEKFWDFVVDKEDIQGADKYCILADEDEGDGDGDDDGDDVVLNTNYKISKNENKYYFSLDTFAKLEQIGREGPWHSVIQRDVTRAFGNMPPHKSGAHFKAESLFRALVNWGRNHVLLREHKASSNSDNHQENIRCLSIATPTSNLILNEDCFGSETIMESNGTGIDEFCTDKSQSLNPNEGKQPKKAIVDDVALSCDGLSTELRIELQNKLGFILHAVAAAHNKIGYCQGMDYIAAHLLRVLHHTDECKTNLDALPAVVQKFYHDKDLMKTTRANSLVVEETVFRVMQTLLITYNLQYMYWPELRYLKICCRVFEVLVEKKLPVLADHFDHHDLNIGIFVLGWFQSLFLYIPSMPTSTINHIWDIWLVERSMKIFFRVGIAILFLCQPILLNNDNEGMMMYLNTFPDATLLNRDILILCALQIKVTNKMLADIEEQVVNKSELASNQTHIIPQDNFDSSHLNCEPGIEGKKF